MLSEKVKVALDRYITSVPDDSTMDIQRRKNDLGQELEYYQDDNGATVAHNDTIFRLSIKTDEKLMHFLVLLESAQELIDEFQQEIVEVSLSIYSDGKSFIREMEEMFDE